ncbi:biopolymer transporter Tol [candidate division KSB1 bacterium]|nr:biopolymer transporter Tol [candidate division KSB1 bacterium]NIS27326.1 biopolymer transporter Tol [candidate division KSB1 bacterium]NIU27408.1 biopolymer transporter Tol [candidate division KSB1 bacterium]NIU93883.1 biopolymer transporter Tol [candidate division KSB1 bacterium]NIV96554.1 biopolymer transporter Tol [candidate division KSB1 bacterium]
MKSVCVSCVCVFVLSSLGWAQPETYNHPELDWYSIETEHFFVHFHNGAERTAKVVGKIAEDIYGPITSLYQYEPDGEYHFIIRDHDDYSNGAAFYYDNKIEIWATPMEFELRGTHNWLRNVVTHEFTHMISLQSARKITQRIPALYIQAIGYEDDRREDVLHGGPNVIASYPISMTVMPAWFAEGIAQYQIPGLSYDTWDSHRDMILRTAALDNKLLSYNEMGVFGKNSLGNEKVYNHGYAFVGFLVKKYGLETIREVAHNMKGFFRITLDGALKKATGKDGEQLYEEWSHSIHAQYTFQTRHISQNKEEGTVVEPKGLANFYPEWSPDGSKIAYITNKGDDYLSQTGLILRDIETGETEGISGGVKYAISWSPDGKSLAYANKSARSEGGSRYYDIYIYDLSENEETRQTYSLRAHSPDWSLDGGSLVFISGEDGTENLSVMNLQSRKIENITDFKHGEQVYKPRWSPDGQSILFGMSIGNGRDIYLMDATSGDLTPVMEDQGDARDAVFSKDGRKIYFSWDKTGIFNIYSLDLQDRKTEQLTNVIGGAFMPSVNEEGHLTFSLFTSDGYKLAVLKTPQPINESKSKYLAQQNGVKLASAGNSVPEEAMVKKISAQNSDDSKLPNYEVTPYSNHYSPIAFLPRLMIDYGTLKVGSYVYSSDVLNKYSFLAGFDVNRRGDYDLFGLLEYRNFGPTLFLEGYNQVQHTSEKVEDREELILRGLDEATDKFKFSLMEVDAGLRFKLSDTNELETAFIFSRYSARAKIPASTGLTTLSYRYFIGRDISIKFRHRAIHPGVHSQINPTGRQFTISYDREFNRFLRDFKTDQVINIENFENFNYNRVALDWKEYFSLPIENHSLSFEFQGGFIDTQDDTLDDGTPKDDSFFYFFGGGLFGNRGYPYFSLEGRKLLLGRVTYRFPLFTHLDLRFMHLYFDKVFLGVFYDYGNAFNENSVDFGDLKSTVGFQFRMDTFSFYSFPTRFSFDAAYGLDRFETANQVYGKEWRFYFGLSFGYLD